MRYDTPITLCRTVPGAYDPATGDYAPDTAEETVVWASVAATRAETMRLLYGELRQGSLTAHVPHHLDAVFDRVRVGSRLYAVDSRRRLRAKESLVLSEVQGG